MIKNIKNKNFPRSFFCQGMFYVSLQLFIILFTSQNVCAYHFRDTVRFKKSIAEKKALVMTDSALNEIGIDSIMNKVEKVHITLTRIINTTAVGFDTKDIEDNIAEVDSNIDIIDENLTLYSSVLDVKNLQMFEVLLKSLSNQLTDWKDEIFKYDKELVGMSDEMGAFKRDTLLHAIINDSAFRSLYIEEIKDLKSKWGISKKAISDNLSRINQLQATVSNEYFTTIDLQNKCRGLLKKISVQSLGKEYDYLWDLKSKTIGESDQANQLAKKSYLGQRKILRYYFRRNWPDLIWMLVTGLIFLFWIFINFRKIKKMKSTENEHERKFSLITKVSILPTLVVLFNIAPFFDIHPPTAYIEITEFLLVVTLTILLWKNWPRKLYYYWLMITVLYIAFSITGALLTPAFNARLLLCTLNFVSIIFGIFWFRTIRKNTVTFSAMIKIVSVIYLILNIGALFCNLFGRLSLAKIFSVTSIFGLTQIIGLSVFIQIVTEAFDLQTMVNKLKGGMAAKLNFSQLDQLLSRALMIVSIIIWCIVFTISLNMYNFVFFKVSHFLNDPRTIGGTTFQIGNILLFLAIIYVSNLLQQGIGSLYGKPEAGVWDPEVKKNGSRLAMTRLILIVIGFLIAIAASGLPIDKITIVLGALGVGIGLGLQTIVNNLVSGVILIFEQPFRIGDFIELGDKRGRVLDIGIRSSKLVMEEGAELIMPNADLLSGRVINWTMRNDNARISLPINVESGYTFEQVQKMILEEVGHHGSVIKNIPSEILLSGITEKTMSLNILVWINDVHRLEAIKSELRNNIYNSLAKEGVKVV